MVSKKRDVSGSSRDFISDLPDPLISHILSFLPTKEAASTSVLSTKWRYLFVFVSNLAFDDSVYLSPREERQFHVTVGNRIVMDIQGKKSFMDFVDRVLALQGDSPVHKFSLKMEDCDETIDPYRIFSWILNVLQRGVKDLDLRLDLDSECLFPSEIFTSETLVRLRLNSRYGPTIDVEDVDVYLPNLKGLYIKSGHFEDNGIEHTKLLSGCHVLEDLVLGDISSCLWDFSSVSVPTLKRLVYGSKWSDENPKSVSFDTPNLVYLEFSDTVADKYPKLNFDSLVEAKIDLRLSHFQIRYIHQVSNLMYHSEDNMVANATDFIMGICNVKILNLSADTLEVLTNCCEAIPLFNNLTHLTVESNAKVGWESLPGLLKNSPNLETLVLQGLVHKVTFQCGDVCLCKHPEKWVEDDEDEEIPTCLSSSPVKLLKIMKFGDDEIENQIEQLKHFLEKMPNLEQLILYYDTSVEEDVIEVSSQLQRLAKVASSKCNLQLISRHLSLSSIVPSSVSMKWASLP